MDVIVNKVFPLCLFVLAVTGAALLFSCPGSPSPDKDHGRFVSDSYSHNGDRTPDVSVLRDTQTGICYAVALDTHTAGLGVVPCGNGR